jgi:hypothetical protein
MQDSVGLDLSKILALDISDLGTSNSVEMAEGRENRLS